MYRGRWYLRPNRVQLGRLKEQLACQYLLREGLSFTANNCYYRCGEIDLIMRDSDCWVFVEVRFRRNLKFGSAAESIGKMKRKKLINAASFWLAQRQLSLFTTDCRFDVVAINDEQILWLKNAFSAEL